MNLPLEVVMPTISFDHLEVILDPGNRGSLGMVVWIDDGFVIGVSFMVGVGDLVELC